MVKNGLHAIALNQRLALGPSLWSRQGLAQLQALVLLPHTRRRRDDSLELLQWLNGHIDALDLHVATAAAADPDARRLMTHPGVGPLTALATVLVLGPVGRFPGSKARGQLHRPGARRQRVRGQVPAGAHQQARQRAPALGARPGRSARDPRRCRSQAHLLRCPPATRPAQAKVALARRLLIRLYVMLRDQIDYDEFCRRGRARRGGLELAGTPV